MSMQTKQIGISEVPLREIKRPIPPVLDHQKIDAMVSTLTGNPKASATCGIEDITAGELPPIDVFRVREEGKDHYFAFGGCHRFQAYDKLAEKSLDEVMVKCRLLPATRKTVKLYLGSSVDELLK